MNKSAVDKINALLPGAKKVEKSHLTRMVKDPDSHGSRPCNDPEIRAAINRVYGRQSPYYYWQRDCEIAEEENRRLKSELKNHDPGWKFHAIAPRALVAYLTFVVMFLLVVFGRPSLDLVVMDRSGAYLNTMYSVEAENAKLRHQLELQQEVIDNLNELAESLGDEVEGVREKLEVLDRGGAG